jgi:hypothetical protein
MAQQKCHHLKFFLKASAIHITTHSSQNTVIKFHVVTTIMNIVVFRDAAMCNLVDTDRHYREVYCPHYQSDYGSSKLLW